MEIHLSEYIGINGMIILNVDFRETGWGVQTAFV
jgi:hypothetical protein